jgi:muconate cycloisomerase
MRVTELRAYHVRIPLRRSIRHASYSRSESDNLIVRCRLEDGTLGYGEGVPREYVTGDTIDSCFDLLRRSDLTNFCASHLCVGFAAAVAAAERLALGPVEDDPRQCHGNAARCAVELAWLDAYGRRFGEPLSAVTRLVAEELWQPRDWVQYSGAITSNTGLKMKAAAWLMRAYGFQHLKVKVGIAGQKDALRLAAIRRHAGKRMDIRLDANEAWPPDSVIERIRELEPFGISSVEQPVSHECVRVLAGVRRQCSTPIMLDESLCSLHDAEQAAKEQTCDLFNLRLSKCGGFIRTLRLAQFAKCHNLGYQLGCQVGETALLSAAGRHFACSVADLRYLEGSYDRRLVREALGQRDLTFSFGGWAPALTGQGLGVDIDEVALKRVTVREETLVG